MHILLTGAYRLFFPAAGLFAALAIPLWLVLYVGVDLSLPEDSFRWHQHEMMFGYLGAALAGFLLTAIPNWTGRPALTGGPLALLFSLWLAGRVGFFVMPEMTVFPLLFPVGLALIATQEIWLGGNKRNLPVAGLVWLFAISDGIFMLVDVDIAKRMGLGVSIVMITLIGGRVTPAFSRNWLRAKGHGITIAPFEAVDKAALVAVISSMASWMFFPEAAVTGWLALCASVLVFARLLRWNGWAVAREPLLLFMHLAYLWIPISLALLGMSILGNGIAFVQVAHAIGAGAVGAMTLIVMMRAMLGHANRPIIGGLWDVVLLGAVHTGAILRILVPVLGDPVWLLHLSGTLWALGFLVFFIRYGRIAFLARL